MSFLVIPMFVGQLNVKKSSKALFSERYGKVPTFKIFGIMFTWRKWTR